MHKFKASDRVQRTHKQVKPAHRFGTVMSVQDGKDNNGKAVRGYRVLMDSDKDGVMNYFTNTLEPSQGTWFCESELKSGK